jgi:type IV secretory pathway VirB4 component
MSSRSERALIKARAAYETAADTYDHTRSEWSLASKAKYAANKAFDAAHTRENRAALRNAEKLVEALLILMTRQGKEMLTLEEIRHLKYRQHVDFLDRKAWRDGATARAEQRRAEARKPV